MPMNLTWVTDPPIARLTEPGQVTTAATFIEKRADDATEGMIDVDTNVRITDICQDMRDAANEKGMGGFEFYLYSIAGSPVVLMSISEDSGRLKRLPKKGLWVEGTVGSPYVTGAGILMKEVAINLSDQKGYGGCVGCAAATPEAEATWSKLGFEKTGETYIEEIDGEAHEFPVIFLDPATRSDLWVKLASKRWHFKMMPLTLAST